MNKLDSILEKHLNENKTMDEFEEYLEDTFQIATILPNEVMKILFDGYKNNKEIKVEFLKFKSRTKDFLQRKKEVEKIERMKDNLIKIYKSKGFILISEEVISEVIQLIFIKK